MAGGRMHTPHRTSLYPLLAISYRNHQKSLAYFSHLAPLILFLFTKRQSQKREGPMAQRFSPKHTPASADVLFFTDIQRGAVEKRKKSSLA